LASFTIIKTMLTKHSYVLGALSCLFCCRHSFFTNRSLCFFFWQIPLNIYYAIVLQNDTWNNVGLQKGPWTRATTKPPWHRPEYIRRWCTDVAPEVRTAGWRDRAMRWLKKGWLSCQGDPHRTTDGFVDFSSPMANDEARSRIPDEGKVIRTAPSGHVLEWPWFVVTAVASMVRLRKDVMMAWWRSRGGLKPDDAFDNDVEIVWTTIISNREPGFERGLAKSMRSTIHHIRTTSDWPRNGAEEARVELEVGVSWCVQRQHMSEQPPRYNL
jgi:hypothetical protein